MHFVPLGDITETPHISDTSSISPRQILHFSTGLKKADPAPIQARDHCVLGKTWSERVLQSKQEQTAEFNDLS
jgi:hypothetical protein